ncbi:Crp/Fnr family transcriptional regulator [Modicisalibacter xianhensis]|uniref:cAMP-binding domain of CRP or a regulatory subunit of cAMP-dependent protein kinases n=1 Tax=Modicisalibacter xianhensis TaxID=442341 RepID=A0A1I2ZY90_9GAMM|nr:Crp/Fnr family transcriptional regulator [Halomonas xianhensis]SFH42640.1 cAMP-binding domain of CRP or a regulatory subunit of cAMP-dependent protein kinases [Halomonas xianhensis]
MSLQASVLIRQFSQYCTLSFADKEILLSLEQHPIRVSAAQAICLEGDEPEQFFTIREGWAFSFRTLDDGSRQILKIYLPGDIIGMRDFSFSQRLAGVAMITDGVICAFNHPQLLSVFHRSGNLAVGFIAIASRQQAMLTERMIYLAQRPAQQRLAHFLYEMYLRLKRIGAVQEGQFLLPLSQEQIGEALGLSAVHVNRTFKAFRESGIVLRERHHVSIPNLKDLANLAEFDGGYLNNEVPSGFFVPQWEEDIRKESLDHTTNLGGP